MCKIFVNTFLAAAFTLGFATIGFGSESEINCTTLHGPTLKGLTCTFTEEWAYAYGSNALDVIEDTATFAKANIEQTCSENGLEFGRYENPNGTGGISNFSVSFEDKGMPGPVVATMSGTFFCIKR